jgi:cyclic pyranopterin phosphate synthase
VATPLSHLNEKNEPQMVNVGDKPVTKRTATARAIVALPENLAAQFADGDFVTKKGSVIQTAILAGIMGAKHTSNLIPLCHPLGLDDCKILIELSGENSLIITCGVSVQARTGVEMEALTGASIAALTIYDMCKAISHDIVIREICLVSKTGGKSDYELQS